MLTSGFHEIEDIVDGGLPSFSFFELPAAGGAGLSSLTLALLLSVLANFFPGHSDTANQAIEADGEGRRAEGAQIAADAPRTLSEQLLSIQTRL